MPPKRGKKAAPARPPLEGCVVAFSGSFPDLGQADLLELAVELGGTTSVSVTKATTHLVTTKADYDRPSAKVKSATKNGIHIVSLQWILDSQTNKVKEPEDNYLLTAATATDPATAPATAPAPSLAPAPAAPAASTSTPATSALPVRATKASGRKRAASPVAVATDADEEQPQSKKTKGKAAEAKPEKAIGEGQVVKSRDTRIPLDDGCPFVTYVVYIDDDGVIFDAALNQTNSSANNNKFYRLQLLHDGSSVYKVWTRWGRVGDRGQTAVLGDGSLADALKNFDKKFKDKAGLTWEKRGDPPRGGNKYTFIERSYEESDDEDEDLSASQAAKKGQEPGWEPPKCTLNPAVQDLLQLIFNQKFFDAAMSNLNYDANKLPLGKLSKATILRGFEALKNLAELIDDASLATTKYQSNLDLALEQLSNGYYSTIPHAFGRNRPPVIQYQEMVKKEIELLESLSDMKDAALIMKMEKTVDSQLHALDRQFQGLNLEEMTPLDPLGDEFRHLSEYLIKTRGATHALNYQVEGIFRIERKGEHERLDKGPFAHVPRDRRLLWHGSRTTNFGGILSQGLRIAPPEAPVSGYMFGKGIYLADMSSKSANYCCSYLSNNTGLLLLCEAELGDPMQHLTNSSYTAGEDAVRKGMYSTWGQGLVGPSAWKDASCVHSSLQGVKMPDTTTMPGQTNLPNAWLQYNEFICYDVRQVQLRYLFRVRM